MQPSALTYNAEVKGGQIIFPERMSDEVANAFPAMKIEVSIKRAGKKVSLKQLGYYFAVVVKYIKVGIYDYTGTSLTDDEVHEFLKLKFRKVQVVDQETGEEISSFGRSIAGAKTWEIAVYIDECIDFALNSLSVKVPLPSTVTDEYFMPEYQRKNERRQDYLDRIEGYLKDITEEKHLYRYFACNKEWSTHNDIRRLFQKRRNELNDLKSENGNG